MNAGIEFFRNDGELDQTALNELRGEKQELKDSQGLFQQQDMVKLIQTYTDPQIPEQFKKNKMIQDFWAILSPYINWTFVEDIDIEEFELLLEQAQLNFLMSRPPYQYTFEDEQLLDQFVIYFLAALKRSRGSKTHKFNERIIEGGTINQIIRSNTDVMQAGNMNKGGFFSNALSKIF